MLAMTRIELEDNEDGKYRQVEDMANQLLDVMHNQEHPVTVANAVAAAAALTVHFMRQIPADRLPLYVAEYKAQLDEIEGCSVQ